MVGVIAKSCALGETLAKLTTKYDAAAWLKPVMIERVWWYTPQPLCDQKIRYWES
jgi:hypothetical protein